MAGEGQGANGEPQPTGTRVTETLKTLTIPLGPHSLS